MTHALWCAAHLTESDVEAGRSAGRCSCKGGTPRCPRTIDMFAKPEPMLSDGLFEDYTKELDREVSKAMGLVPTSTWKDAALAGINREGLDRIDRELLQQARGIFVDFLVVRGAQLRARMAGLDVEGLRATHAHRPEREGAITIFFCGGHKQRPPPPSVPRGREVKLLIEDMPRPKKPPRRKDP